MTTSSTTPRRAGPRQGRADVVPSSEYLAEVRCATGAFVWVWLPGSTEPVVCGRIEQVGVSELGPVLAFTYGALRSGLESVANTTRRVIDMETANRRRLARLSRSEAWWQIVSGPKACTA